MTDRELLLQVLLVLEKISMGGDPAWADDVLPALRTRIAQSDPINKEPTKLLLIPELMEQAGWVRKKEWVGLTDDERKEILKGKNNGK